MGIDINRKNDRKFRRTAPTSEDPYLWILAKLYTLLARRTGEKFNNIMMRRMYRCFRAPLSLARISRVLSKKGNAGKLVVTCITVIDDGRATLYLVPKFTLYVTKGARFPILKADGEMITLDQLALRTPKGENSLQIQGPRKAHEAQEHFGPAQGLPHSHTEPYLRSKGRKFDRAPGRRASRGYKA
ncbi:unnamed protein product [Nippostrongylus brasiliensis]|uniref:Large ribosomal subunit protein eL18 n=1 Tax=Nippostrongylus brasiliensis TaxID=27835 RepID=A0A0N4YSQ7_NIPBR|nr:unnamed protein product [Nippostrongylus brasiliensis]